MSSAVVKSIITPNLLHLLCFVQYAIYFAADVFLEQLRGVKSMGGTNPVILVSKKVISILKSRKIDFNSYCISSRNFCTYGIKGDISYE